MQLLPSCCFLSVAVAIVKLHFTTSLVQFTDDTISFHCQVSTVCVYLSSCVFRDLVGFLHLVGRLFNVTLVLFVVNTLRLREVRSCSLIAFVQGKSTF